jgi:hypothetical protein
MVKQSSTGGWITKMILYKNSYSQYALRCDISPIGSKSTFVKTWTQNPTTKIFE